LIPPFSNTTPLGADSHTPPAHTARRTTPPPRSLLSSHESPPIREHPLHGPGGLFYWGQFSRTS